MRPIFEYWSEVCDDCYNITLEDKKIAKWAVNIVNDIIRYTSAPIQSIKNQNRQRCTRSYKNMEEDVQE